MNARIDEEFVNGSNLNQEQPEEILLVNTNETKSKKYNSKSDQEFEIDDETKNVKINNGNINKKGNETNRQNLTVSYNNSITKDKKRAESPVSKKSVDALLDSHQSNDNDESSEDPSSINHSSNNSLSHKAVDNSITRPSLINKVSIKNHRDEENGDEYDDEPSEILSKSLESAIASKNILEIKNNRTKSFSKSLNNQNQNLTNITNKNNNKKTNSYKNINFQLS